MNLIDYINKSKKLQKDRKMKLVKIAFLSNFTLNGLAETMKVLCYEQKISAKCYIAPYGQYAQEILNLSSGLHKFKPDIIFILLDTEQLLGDFYYFAHREEKNKKKKFIQNKFIEFKKFIKILNEKTSAKIVFNNLLVPHYSGKGIIEHKEEFGLRRIVISLNELIESISRTEQNFLVFDMNIFCGKVGYECLVDKKMHYLADMRISAPALIKLAMEYMAYIFPLMSITKKCIVLDCDNTLWGGVIGEDGISNIKLGPDNQGKPFLDFQKRLLELHERGIILAINSKNNYDDVVEVMRKHKYMLLKEDNFACMKINWYDKATNMREIAKELNIGLDSMVFIDDDRSNCDMIRKLIPEVMVVELPEDTSLYSYTIENLKVFDTFSITKEDMKRGEMYSQEKKRKELKSVVKDIDSYIRQLQVKITIYKADKSNIPRIAQLTQKTNQFNLTTKRYSEEEIKLFSQSEDYIVKCINVEDKFGDYGITGVAIVKKFNVKKYWEIDTFLLSCRVLGKNVESTFMKSLVNDAGKNNIKELRAKFIKTSKNKPAEKFLDESGFKLVDKNRNTSNYALNLMRMQ